MQSRIITKAKLKRRLEAVLERAGVGAPVAREHAAGFLRELEGGEVLGFADLGKLHLEGGKVVVRPAEALAAPPVAPDRRTAAVEAGPPVFTVEAEASIRELESGGYSRRQAEKALLALSGR